MKKYSEIRKFILFFIFAFSISVFYAAACSDNATEPSNEVVLPDSNLNFTEHIRPLFINRCASRSGCHSSFEPAGGLDLTNYLEISTHLIDGSVPLIIPGQGSESFLYLILIAPQLGRDRMPKDEAPLSGKNISGIRTWIDEGALEFP